MMFIVVVFMLWCRYLSSQAGAQPQLYADNLKCVSRDLDLLLNAALASVSFSVPPGMLGKV